eukprot:10718591-Alexandrium_andersonii.AAC.1
MTGEPPVRPARTPAIGPASRAPVQGVQGAAENSPAPSLLRRRGRGELEPNQHPAVPFGTRGSTSQWR